MSAAGSGDAAVRQIGPYRLLQLLGEGGMGEVWLAEQVTPIRRSVALKLIKAGMDTKAVVARFESERQALALMDHPNIARVYDAGTTPEGRPYFAMEYVPGHSITDYCDRHRLTIKERLELVMQVCDGVEHAHQKAIIHRDLKPSNVLVVTQNDKAVPKIIDFGLAKAMAQPLTEKTMFTELGVLLGTPEYMSPEQADLLEQNIDTRTDVYSLGVILYELLVGALPFDTKTLRAAGLEAILRLIREEDPPKPSTRVRMMGPQSPASAEKRGEEPQSLARHLEGELDWITLKALEKDRARRYGTISALSADLTRYLRSEPVAAGPATAGYRLRKYASRHRFGLLTASALVLLLAGSVGVQAFQLQRTRLEMDRANRERDRANRITDFMTGMFKLSDPGEARGNSVVVREILDKASANIDSSLTQDPELQAQMMFTMAVVYDNLGLYPRAQALDERALEICRRTFGPEHDQTLKTMQNLAIVMAHQGRYDQTENLLRQLLEIQRRTRGAEDPRTSIAMSNLAVVLHQQGKFAEAAQLNRQLLDIQRRVLGPEHRNTVRTTANLAAVLIDQGQFAEAEALDREVLAIQQKAFGPDDPDTIRTMSTLAIVLYNQQKYAEAEKWNRLTLEGQRRIYGPEHPWTMLAVNTMAAILSGQEKHADAEKVYRQALDIQRRLLGKEHPDTLRTMVNLVLALAGQHKYDEAEAMVREALAIQRRVLGPQHPDVAASIYNLGCVMAQRGNKDEALSLLRQAVDGGLPPQMDVNMDKDSALAPLAGDARFVALVAHAKEVAAAAQKPR
jgi:serine/threonine protein kinase/Tfp pilus assembly protein PilF